MNLVTILEEFDSRMVQQLGNDGILNAYCILSTEELCRFEL